MVLAEAADNETRQTFIGHDTIAERSRVSSRTVADVMKRLESGGWILRQRRYANGLRSSDLTTLTLHAAAAPNLDAVTACKEGGLPAAERKAYMRQPQGIPEYIPKKENMSSTAPTIAIEKSKRDHCPVEFERLWEAYPSSRCSTFPNMGRGRSKKPKALAEWKKLNDTDRAAFVVAVCSYVSSPEAKKDGGQFVPAMERWIRDETWRDFISNPAEGEKHATGPNWAERMEHWSKGKWNTTEWGPKPGTPGCRVPANHLQG